MNKKVIAFRNGVLPINNNIVFGAGFRNSGAKKNIISEITQSMGGMLIGDRNVSKGRGTGVSAERKRPIRFIV